jgi:hypothetical protein
MTPEQLSANLNKVNQQIAQDFPLWANVALGNTALAMLKERIIKTGVASDGSPYKPYSTSPILVGAKSFRTKAAAASVFGSKEKRKSLQWRTIDRGGSLYRLALLPGGYKQVRQIDGSQVAHKSFLRTGEMWMSVHNLGTKQEGQMRFTTTIGTQVELSNKKLEGNTVREGKEILMISQKEEKALTEILDKYITNTINKAING